MKDFGSLKPKRAKIGKITLKGNDCFLSFNQYQLKIRKIVELKIPNCRSSIVIHTKLNGCS